jgi:protein TonB
VKSHERKTRSATFPFAASLVLHAVAALVLLLGFRDRQTPKTLTPIELVGPHSSGSLRVGADRKSKQERSDRSTTVPKKDDPTAQSYTLKPKALDLSHADSDRERLNQTPSESLEVYPGSESGTSVGEGAFATGSPLQMYVASIIKRIDEVKIYPADAIFRGEQGRVVVAIQVFPDGTIQHFHLTEPCPFESLNNAALETIARLKRLSPLPENRRRPLTIRLPLNYEINRR